MYHLLYGSRVELHICLAFVLVLYEFIIKAGFLSLPVVMFAGCFSEELHYSLFMSEDPVRRTTRACSSRPSQSFACG